MNTPSHPAKGAAKHDPSMNNIRCVYHGGMGYEVSYCIGESRFHIWTDELNAIRGNRLYKNSQANQGEPGYHECRYLDPFKRQNAANIEYALSQVSLSQAKAVYDENEMQIERERAEEALRIKREKILHAAAPELLEALRIALDRLSQLEGGSKVAQALTGRAMLHARTAIARATDSPEA